jgi:hypothetical protein
MGEPQPQRSSERARMVSRTPAPRTRVVCAVAEAHAPRTAGTTGALAATHAAVTRGKTTCRRARTPRRRRPPAPRRPLPRSARASRSRWDDRRTPEAVWPDGSCLMWCRLRIEVSQRRVLRRSGSGHRSCARPHHADLRADRRIRLRCGACARAPSRRRSQGLFLARVAERRGSAAADLYGSEHSASTNCSGPRRTERKHVPHGSPKMSRTRQI